MKPVTVGKQQSKSAYLNTAPKALIQLYKQSPNGEEILGRLLTSACQKTPVFKSSAGPILAGAAFFRDLISGQWSIRINDKWRICFNWSEGDAMDVEIADYH